MAPRPSARRRRTRSFDVLGTDLGRRCSADAWAAGASTAAGGPGVADMVRRRARRATGCPRRIDLPRVAERGRTGRARPGRTSCSTPPSCPAWSAYAASPRRADAARRTPPTWPAGSAAALGLLVRPAERRRAAATRAAAAAGRRPAARRPAYPPEHRAGSTSRPSRHARADPARWIRCARRSGRGCCRVTAGDRRRRPGPDARPGAAGVRRGCPTRGRRRRVSPAGPPPRRHPQDRHVVPPGRAVPQP